MADITRILSDLAQGDAHAAEELLPLVYDELRRHGGQPSQGRSNLGLRLARVPFDAAPPEANTPPDPEVKQEPTS